MPIDTLTTMAAWMEWDTGRRTIEKIYSDKEDRRQRESEANELARWTRTSQASGS